MPNDDDFDFMSLPPSESDVAWLAVGSLVGALWMRAGGWAALLTGGRS